MQWIGRPAVVRRPCRHARGVLPGHQPIRRRRPAAAGAAGDLPVGRLHRRLPRPACFPAAFARTASPVVVARTFDAQRGRPTTSGRCRTTHPLRDDFWRSLAPDLSAINVPMLVCGSFSDNNLHSRGSIRAFTRGGSTHARLYTHRGGKWATFYSEAALRRAAEVLPRRAGRRAPPRAAFASRCARTATPSPRCAKKPNGRWPVPVGGLCIWPTGALTTDPPPTPGSITFETHLSAAAFSWTVARGHRADRPDGCPAVGRTGRLRRREPVRRRGEVARRHGPSRFEGSYGYGRDRVATGWQRVALRALDPELSQPWEPVPTCTEPQPVSAGEVVAVDVALGPSATLFRAGEQLRLVVAGRWLWPTQSADRSDSRRPMPIRARSRHPALGPALRRAPADPGDPLAPPAPTRSRRPCPPRPRRRR